MEIIARAHAKLIIIGEHFVVPWLDSQGNEHPGSAALAVPLPELWTEVRLGPSPGSQLVCQPLLDSAADIDLERTIQLMEKVAWTAAETFGWDLRKQPLSLKSRSNFPISRGLGSSASFSVAASRAFASLCASSSPVSIQMLATLAQKVENLFHSRSSGLDTSVILEDKPVVFRSGKIQSIFQPRSVDFVVADSGPRDHCSSILQKTLELRQRDPNHWALLSRRTDQLAEQCRIALEDPQGAADAAQTIDRAHQILAEIGLVTPNVCEVLQLGMESGALAGKVSGAGAGGAVLFVARKGEGVALAEALEEAGVHVLARSNRSTQESPYLCSLNP